MTNYVFANSNIHYYLVPIAMYYTTDYIVGV